MIEIPCSLEKFEIKLILFHVLKSITVSLLTYDYNYDYNI